MNGIIVSVPSHLIVTSWLDIKSSSDQISKVAHNSLAQWKDNTLRTIRSLLEKGMAVTVLVGAGAGIYFKSLLSIPLTLFVVIVLGQSNDRFVKRELSARCQEKCVELENYLKDFKLAAEQMEQLLSDSSLQVTYQGILDVLNQFPPNRWEHLLDEVKRTKINLSGYSDEWMSTFKSEFGKADYGYIRIDGMKKRLNQLSPAARKKIYRRGSGEKSVLRDHLLEQLHHNLEGKASTSVPVDSKRLHLALSELAQAWRDNVQVFRCYLGTVQ